MKHQLYFDDGSAADFHLLIAVPEHRVPAAVREAGLIDETGWVRVHPRTMETRFQNVFAAGDLTYISMPDGEQLPKAGAFAERQAETAAANIAYRVTGGRPPAPFGAKARFFMDVGAGAATVFEGDFFARQRRINMKQPSIVWHWARRARERYWRWRRS